MKELYTHFLYNVYYSGAGAEDGDDDVFVVVKYGLTTNTVPGN